MTAQNERPLTSMQEIQQALWDLPRLTRRELEKVRCSIGNLTTNERHRFFTELILLLGDEMMSLGHAMERNREAVENSTHRAGGTRGGSLA